MRLCGIRLNGLGSSRVLRAPRLEHRIVASATPPL